MTIIDLIVVELQCVFLDGSHSDRLAVGRLPHTFGVIDLHCRAIEVYDNGFNSTWDDKNVSRRRHVREERRVEVET